MSGNIQYSLPIKPEHPLTVQAQKRQNQHIFIRFRKQPAWHIVRHILNLIHVKANDVPFCQFPETGLVLLLNA